MHPTFVWNWLLTLGLLRFLNWLLHSHARPVQLGHDLIGDDLNQLFKIRRMVHELPVGLGRAAPVARPVRVRRLLGCAPLMAANMPDKRAMLRASP